jgi:tetratricopeptide (TPR) repeat protein
LGNTYAHKGDYPAALIAYEKALSLKKDYPEAKFNLEYVQLLIPKVKPDEQEEGPPGDPTFDPDEIKFDEKGKKGKEGEIDQAQLTDEQVTELWMRRIQTSPAQFLRLKFSYQLQMREGEKTTYNFREMDVAELSRRDSLSAMFLSRDGTRQAKNLGKERILPKDRSREKNATTSQSIESQPQIDETHGS